MKKMYKILAVTMSLFAIFTTACSTGTATTSSEECVHAYGEWKETKKATCKEEGEKERVCSLCGDKETETTKGAHNKYSVWTSTETSHYRVCRTCGERFDSGVHNYVDGVCEDCEYVQVVTTVWDVPDFVIEIEEERDLRVLFLADTQIIDSSQMRTPDRLGQSSIDKWAPENMEDMCFKYVRDAVQKSDPDFIILLGDNVYGEFDDRGTSLQKLIEVMDSFEIPWSPVYGNHDNESKKGAKWQNAQFEGAEYCYFKKGDTDGNGNYTVAIKQGEEIVRMFYMMDSNFAMNASNPAFNNVVLQLGFTQNQVNWMYERMETLEEAYGKKVPSTLSFHVATKEYSLAEEKYSKLTSTYTLNAAGSPPAENGDFGSKLNASWDVYDVPSAKGKSFLDICKKFKVDTTFCGHEHKTNISLLYEGIRWTFGLKTGTYDSHNTGEVGGTLMTFNKTSYSIKHLYYDAEMQAKMDALRK